MSELDPALASAFAGRRVLFFGAVELLLPSRAVRLLDGAGEVMIGSDKYSGRDPDWGVLDSVKGLSESLEGRSPQITLGFTPASSASLAMMLDPALQNSPVTIMAGCLDPATGQCIGEPYVLASGELDVPTPRGRGSVFRVEMTVTGIGERLFTPEEGRRLTSAFHQKIWPGELGLDFVSDVESWVPWGQELKAPSADIRTNMGQGGGIGMPSLSGFFRMAL